MKRRKSLNKKEIAQKAAHSIFKKGFVLTLYIFLLFGNVIIFTHSMKISDDLVYMESESIRLKDENSVMEKKYYEVNSFQNLEELADQLGFTKSAEPIVLDDPTYASLQ